MIARLPGAVLSLLLGSIAARAQMDGGLDAGNRQGPAEGQRDTVPASGSSCGENPEQTILSIVRSVAQAGGFRWSGPGGTDPITGWPVRFVFDADHRFTRFDCESGLSLEGTSFASTGQCGQAFVLSIGYGICEAVQNEDQLAQVVGHEFGHLVLDHFRKGNEFINQGFQTWFETPEGRQAYADANAEVSQDLAQRMQGERDMPNPAREEDMRRWALGVMEQDVWHRYKDANRVAIQRYYDDEEDPANEQSMVLIRDARFDPRRAVNAPNQGHGLAVTCFLVPDLRHPASAVRAALLRKVAAQLDRTTP